MPLVRRHEFIDLGKRRVAPSRPIESKLLADAFERAARVEEKGVPVDKRARFRARFEFRVQDVAQPHEAALAQRSLIALMERERGIARSWSSAASRACDSCDS